MRELSQESVLDTEIDHTQKRKRKQAMLSVMKYGGQALASPHHLQHLITQVRNHIQQVETPPLVVVSAMAGTRKRLHTLARLVREGHASAADTLLEQIKQTHRARARESVLDPIRAQALLHALEASYRDLTREVEQLAQLPYGSAAVPWHITRLTTWGERLAVLIVASALEDAGLHAEGVPDALVQTAQPSCDDTPDGIMRALPLLQETRQRACQILIPILGKHCIPVVAGDLAHTRRGSSTSLGSQGADLTAALLAVALHARSLIIATMGAGILSADPHLVPDAVPLRALAAEEALALLSPGARLVHPQTIPLLAAAGIPLWVRSLLDLDAPGTRVSVTTHSSAVTAALALHPAVTLLTFTRSAHLDAQTHLAHLLHLVSQIGIAPLMLTLTDTTQLAILIEEQAMEAVMEVCAEAADTWKVDCQRGLAACHGIGAYFGRQPLIRAQAVMALLDEGITVLSQGCSAVGMMLVVPASEGARSIHCLHHGFMSPVVLSNGQVVEQAQRKVVIQRKERA